MGLLDNSNGLTGTTIAIGAGAAALGVAAGLGTAAIVGASKRRKSKRRKSRNSRKRNYRSKKVRRNKKRYYPEPKGKKYSRKKIRYTKNGQPYIIMASGKARFISKRGAKLSKKRKGGRY